MTIEQIVRKMWRDYQQHQRRKAYNDYLKSDDWQHIRKIKLQFADNRCEMCLRPAAAGNPLDVHHVTYERFGHENLTDLRVLCRQCHQTVHGREF